MRFTPLLCVLLFLAPSLALSQGAWQPVSQAPPAVQPPQQQDMQGQDVEEPDSPDDDTTEVPETPPTPPVPQPVAATPAPSVAAPPKPENTATPSNPSEIGDENYDKVVLQGLNKVTARAVTLEAPIGEVVRFGTIEIIAHACWKSAPEERPENAALLEISEIKQGEAPRRIFLGWMFSSSPGLSSLEHPFYDVTVVKCDKAQAPTPPVPAPAEKPHKKKKPS